MKEVDMTGPRLNGNASPFGAWAPYVASVIALGVILAALIDHLLVATSQVIAADPFLDSAALLVIGVVLGVGVIGGTATSALSSATAAHVRLDELGAPPADGQPQGPGVG